MLDVQKIAPNDDSQRFSLRQLITMCALLQMPFVSIAQAQAWEGTPGTSPIVLKLDPDATEPSGEYFYRKHRHGIELS